MADKLNGDYDGRYTIYDNFLGKEIDIYMFVDYAKQAGWEKAYAGMICKYIGVLETTASKVLIYLIAERDATNRIFGSQRDMAKACGVSLATISKVFIKLKAKGLIKEVAASHYIITPKMLRNGDNKKGAMMLRLWSEVDE